MKFPPIQPLPRRTVLSSLALGALAALGLSGCSPAGPAKDTIVVAIVANPQMKDAISLQDDFKAKHPNVNVKFVTLPEMRPAPRSPHPWQPAAASSTSS